MQKLSLILLTMFCGCSDVVSTPAPWSVEDKNEGDGVQPVYGYDDVVEPLVGVVFDLPGFTYSDLVFVDCGDSIAGDLTEVPTASADAPSTLEEWFGDDGCVSLRHRKEHGVDGLTWERQDVVNTKINENVFVPYVTFERELRYGEGLHVSTDGRTEPDGEWLPEGFDIWERLSYDDDGRILSHDRRGVLDFNADQLIEETWTYHASGEVSENAMFADGRQIVWHRWVRNAEGLPTEYWALGPNDTLFLRESWTYDLQSRIDSSATYDVDGSLLVSTTHRYDRNDIPHTKELKYHDRGWREVYTFDSRGNELRFTQDEDDDGVIEYVRASEFDESENQTFSRTAYEFTASGPERWDEARYEYDAQNRVTHEDHSQRTFNASRSPNYLIVNRRVEWQYDGDVRRSQVFMSDENTTEFLAEERDYAGDLISRWVRDSDRDGDLDIEVESDVDRNGRLLERRGYREGDLRSIEQWFYDGNGNILRQLAGWADGVVSSRNEYRYHESFRAE